MPGVPPPLIWEEGTLLVLDQRLLPGREVYLTLRSTGEVADAIKKMVLRGAPLIGIAGAYGAAMARDPDRELPLLRAARPTAVNLAWAVDRVERAIREGKDPVAEAEKIHREEKERTRKMAEEGLGVVPADARVMTYCNTGVLATGGLGTALGVIYRAHRRGLLREVWVPETRPYLQGSRLTSYELTKARISHHIITDNAAAWVMAQGLCNLVLVGADRIAKNGDFANKIGTLSLALAAKRYGVPFWVVAPTSSFDLSLPDGSAIPVEERGPMEVMSWGSVRVAPPGAKARAWAFDITPGELVEGYITERGIIKHPGELL